MTPPALDRDVLQAELRALRELLDDLDAVPELDRPALEQDRMLRHAIERVLTQVVELAAGINNHLVVARLGTSAPSLTPSPADLTAGGRWREAD